MHSLKYLSAYKPELQQQIADMLERDTLSNFLLTKYPDTHKVANDTDLREHVMELKNRFMRKSAPLSKICFDKKIHVVNNALGLHTYVSRIQGARLKNKNELRVSTLFKNTPEDFLNMIVVHELAHLREKDHNKAFYMLCLHMLPDYHQIEFDVRVYLTQLEERGEIYTHPSSK